MDRLHDLPALLTVDDLSDHLGVPVDTIYWWRTRGEGPPGVKVGRHLRYRAADVVAWIEEHAQVDQRDRERRAEVNR